MRRQASSVAAVVLVACSSSTTTGGTSGGAPIVVPGPCEILIDQPPLLPAQHVAEGTEVTYSSNPPSSGPHYPIWAAYQTYSKPIARGYYVHDLEHGAIVFVYKCDAADGCPDVVRALQDASNAIPTDPLCTSDGAGVRVRTVITPDPLLDVPVAAAAWGYTYKAKCVDPPSLAGFAKAHYAQGPENICSNGAVL